MVFIAMTVWNDFMMPLYFFSTAGRWTMPLMVYNFFGQYFRQWNYVFACLILTYLPISILYLTARDNHLRNDQPPCKGIEHVPKNSAESLTPGVNPEP